MVTIKYSGIKGYLEAEYKLINGRRNRPGGCKYYSINDLVLHLGQYFKPAPLPPNIKFGPIKQCYANATQLALEHPNLIYCEGLANCIIPVSHAWCITQEGNVVDNTWRTVGKEYFGVPIKTEYLEERVALTGMGGPVLDDWENHWPIMSLPLNKWRYKFKNKKQ